MRGESQVADSVIADMGSDFWTDGGQILDTTYTTLRPQVPCPGTKYRVLCTCRYPSKMSEKIICLDWILSITLLNLRFASRLCTLLMPLLILISGERMK